MKMDAKSIISYLIKTGIEMIIDCHTHITGNGKWFETGLGSSPEILLAAMKNANIDQSLLLPIYGTITNSGIAEVVKQYPGKFIGFGSIDIATWKSDIEEITHYRLKGIKFHPRMQDQTLFSLENSGALQEMNAKKLPLLICGWQQTSSDHAPMGLIGPVIVDAFAKKYKDMNFIIAHMGGHKFWDAFFCARGNKNVYLDCSYFLKFFRGTSIEKDFWSVVKLIDEKLIYGSDFPEIDMKEYKEYFEKKATLAGLDTEKICYSNFQKAVPSY